MDHDIAASAPTLDQAIRRLRLTVEAERKYTTEKFGEAFKGVPAAPAFVVRKYDEAMMKVSPTSTAGGLSDFHLAA